MGNRMYDGRKIRTDDQTKAGLTRTTGAERAT